MYFCRKIYNMSYILSNQYVRIEPRPAGFGPRILAAFLDALAILFYLYGLSLLLFGTGMENLLNGWLAAALYTIPTMFYYPLCEFFFNGKSLGKQILGLRVVKRDGSRPGLSAFMLRWLLLTIDAGTGFVVGILCIMFSKNSQRLGDMAAGTMVVSDRLLNNNRVQLSEFNFLTDNYRPTFPTAPLLTAGQADAIRLTLSLYGGGRTGRILELTGKVASIVGPVPTGMDAETYLLTVWRDYQFYQL